MAMKFTKATRKKTKLRLALAGPSGSGKTYSAILIAKGIGGRIAVIDTEEGSASMYSHLVEFETLELHPPYESERFIEAIRVAESAGFTTLIIDSMTHEWDGAGGCLEANETLAHARFKGNTWAAWNETTPRHRAFVDAILQSPMHIICTMRSKTETVQGDDKKVKKLGMKSIQRDGTDYEFTTVLDLTHDNHYAIASKDRTGLFPKPELLGESTGRRLVEWLNSGAEPTPPLVVDTAKLKAVMVAKGWSWARALGAIGKNHNTVYSGGELPASIQQEWLADFLSWLEGQPDATPAPAPVSSPTEPTRTASPSKLQPLVAEFEAAGGMMEVWLEDNQLTREAFDKAKAGEFDRIQKLLRASVQKLTGGTLGGADYHPPH